MASGELAWEAWMAGLYGESHFLCNLHQRDSRFWIRLVRLALPLVSHLGGVAPGFAAAQ